MPDATSLSAGFMVVHGNRLDELRSLVVSWMRRYPLAPLENEIALVQSNGIAQWLKLALAEDPEEDDMGGCGIAAALFRGFLIRIICKQGSTVVSYQVGKKRIEPFPTKIPTNQTEG